MREMVRVCKRRGGFYHQSYFRSENPLIARRRSISAGGITRRLGWAKTDLQVQRVLSELPESKSKVATE